VKLNSSLETDHAMSVRTCVKSAKKRNFCTLRHMDRTRIGKAAPSAILLLGLALTATSHTALAAPTDDRTDVQQLRADAAARNDRNRGVNRGISLFVADAANQEDNWGFTFTSLIPTLYNSNAEAVPSDGMKSFEWNPEVRLGWTKQLANSINVSALVDLNSDRYTHGSDANTDTSYGRMRAQRITGNDDQEFQPFFEYSPRLIFTPFFKRNSATLHDFRLGTDKVYNFDGNWQPVASPPNSSGNRIWAISVTADVSRRHTNSGPSSTRLEIDPSLAWYPSAKPWNVSLEIDAIPTLYDKSSASSRYATATTAILTYEYAPTTWSWKEHNRTLKLDFQIVYARVDSADTPISFKQWAIGPALKGAMSF